MAAAIDPYYDRKRVPKELIADVGLTSLTSQDEHMARERKLSRDGNDLRRFSNPKTKLGKDPYYQRTRLPDSMIVGVGDTGLTQQEEHMNRERKYSLPDGSDVRRFSNKLTPQHDPFYGRRRISNAEISGVGETGNTPVEDYAVRERKQSLAQLSDDPFKQISGSGHRGSISAASIGAASAASERRRSSAIAMHSDAHHRLGGEGARLEPIESRAEDMPSSSNGMPSARHHNIYAYDEDPDSVAPDEIR